MSAESLAVRVSSSIGDAAAVIAAATSIYDALYYTPSAVEALPTHVKIAYSRLGGALERLSKGGAS